MKVAIIGGSGKMGRWFASFLAKEGKQVTITGRNEAKLRETGRQLGVETATNEEAVKNADVVVLSVLPDNFEAVAKQISPYTRPDQIIADITSVKVLPVEAMHRHLKAGVVLGVHPMFGPGAKDMTNQNFVLTPTSEAETALANKAREYLEARGARVTLMTPREHDEMMSIVLGLSHFVALVSADTLVNLDRSKETAAISGSTYKLLQTLIGSVISEDPEFFASLHMHLPDVPKIEEQFQKSAKTWADLVKNKDQQEFVNRMNALKSKLEKGNIDFQKAYQNMYKIVEGLNK